MWGRRPANLLSVMPVPSAGGVGVSGRSPLIATYSNEAQLCDRHDRGRLDRNRTVHANDDRKIRIVGLTQLVEILVYLNDHCPEDQLSSVVLASEVHAVAAFKI